MTHGCNRWPLLMYLLTGDTELEDDDLLTTNLGDAMEDYDEEEYQEWKPHGGGNFTLLKLHK